MEWNNKIYFNYHKHTHLSNLSTLDCIVKPIDYIKRAKELGHTAYFTTEHGWGGDVWEAYTLCQENDLKCIYSAEVYYVDDRFEKDRSNYHLILIALNNEGRKDINRIISLGNTEGFYYKARIDLSLLLSLNPKNVIVTTACVASRLFKTENYEEEFLKPVFNHFGEHLFLEVQCHDENIQKKHNERILKISEKYGIPIIHANDSHYISQKDSKYRDIFLKAKGLNYEDESGFILDYPTYDEILERYENQGILTKEQSIQALENTKIFEQCEDLGLDKDFKIPNVCGDEDENEVLWNILKEEWAEKKQYVPKERHQEYSLEILTEYNIIKKCGMANYFILDYKVVDRAKNVYNCVLTKSGRGSAVSFLVNKILDLTEVDIKKSPVTLYPSRFITAERILETRSLPDIDLNWASESIDGVIQATKDILGEDNIYYMIAYKNLQDSSAFRLWCKSQDMEIESYNEIAKDLDNYINDPYWGEIIEQSKIFRGVIESVAPSPCSFLLLDKPISEEVGLIKVGDVICCCLTGYQCDCYKFLKNDYLSVQVYSLISNVYKTIGRPIDSIEFITENSDEKVWKLYEDGITATLNQIDSDYARNLVMKYKPTRLSELCAFVAGLRPGFASLLNNFIERKPYSTGVKELDELLEDSFHYMIYQESVMKVLTWLGIKESETYDIIKKISKKKFTHKQLEDLKSKLRINWVNIVGDDSKFDETWQTIENFALYGFNASHSLSVAIDSLYGAYLKANYPLEYMTCALNLYTGNIEETTKIIKELPYFNITINPPKFRYSKAEYMFDRDTNSIYKGIASIKFLNEKVANELYNYKDEEFENFTSLIRVIMMETSINFRQLKILTKLNYFSEFGKNKKLLSIIDEYESKLKNKKLSEKTVVKRMAELFEFEKTVENKSLDVKTQIGEEIEVLGSPMTIVNTLPNNLYSVLEIKGTQLKLYQISTGEILDFRVKQTDIAKNTKFGQFNIIQVQGIKRQNKRKKNGDSWITLPDEYNIYLSTWKVLL